VNEDARGALSAGAQEILGRPLTSTEQGLFDNYMNLLIKWSSVHRMIGWTEPRWIVENLFLDSLLFFRVLPENTRSMMDLGAGAGIPGIPLKIVQPRLQITLLEARQRRASFLSTVVRELGLIDATVIEGRAESLVPERGGEFDAVVMRCAGDLEELFPVAARFIRPGGVVVASGPPEPFELKSGEWIQVQGLRPGLTRRFAVSNLAAVRTFHE
jgi:16S rRNA (guanine527-N7)-methyltransferase